MNQSLQEGLLNIVLLNFDADKSIIKLGNGSNKLKPVIPIIETATSGSIKGHVTPIVTFAVVEARSGGSFSTNVNAQRNF